GQPAALEHGDVRDAVLGGEVVGRGQPVAAGAHDDHVVGRLRLRGAPEPVGVLGELGHHRFVAVSPPSTTSACALTYRASSETRNAPTSAMSSPVPWRPIGTWRSTSSWIASSLQPSKSGSLKPVRIQPGQTQLTRTPSREKSAASCRVRLMIAAFDVL